MEKRRRQGCQHRPEFDLIGWGRWRVPCDKCLQFGAQDASIHQLVKVHFLNDPRYSSRVAYCGVIPGCRLPSRCKVESGRVGPARGRVGTPFQDKNRNQWRSGAGRAGKRGSRRNSFCVKCHVSHKHSSIAGRGVSQQVWDSRQSTPISMASPTSILWPSLGKH